MSSDAKAKLLEAIGSIEDNVLLDQIMSNVAFLVSETDIVDGLTLAQLNQLDEAIAEADGNQTISLAAFKKEMAEWETK